MMITNEDQNLKISLPRFFFIPFTLGAILLLLALIFYASRLIQSEPTILDLIKVLFLFIIFLAGSYFFSRILFYSVTAREIGLETHNIWGKKKVFLWKDIVQIRRPRFGIPKDASYVISSSEDKMLLVRSLKNYSELVQIIKVRAQNLQKCQP
jgi:hypothetical protein